MPLVKDFGKVIKNHITILPQIKNKLDEKYWTYNRTVRCVLRMWGIKNHGSKG